MPTSPRPLPRPGDPLRIAYLVYRGNPHCGGQGVYSRHLTRELANLGHHVEVYAGQPWPELDDPVTLNEVASLDLYRRENPFRVPWPHEYRSLIDLREFAVMCAAGFVGQVLAKRVYQGVLSGQVPLDTIRYLCLARSDGEHRRFQERYLELLHACAGMKAPPSKEQVL